MDVNDSWLQVFSLFFANAGLMVWFRTESRNDWRQMDAKLDASVTAIRQEVQAIHEEIKDFHGRLCALEEKNKEVKIFKKGRNR